MTKGTKGPDGKVWKISKEEAITPWPPSTSTRCCTRSSAART